MVNGISGSNANPDPGQNRTNSDNINLDVKSVCIWLDTQNNNDGNLTYDDIYSLQNSEKWNKLPDSFKNYINRLLIRMPLCSDMEARVNGENVKLASPQIDFNNSLNIDKLQHSSANREYKGDLCIVTEIINFNENSITERISTYDTKSNKLIGLMEKETIYSDSNKLHEKTTSFDPETMDILYTQETESFDNLDGSTHMSIQISQPIGGVKCKVREASFDYNRKAMEDYVINAKDAPYFSKINEIRAKDPSALTEEEQNLLEEFNNMMDYVITAGTEYGVDPNRILAIIQQETKFNGLSPHAVGVNGKGYMQLTSAPIKDFLGYGSSGWGKDNKLSGYGHEFEELLISRGFNPNCSYLEKYSLNNDIMAYLKANNDPDFNIRLGALVLRHYLDRYNGNMGMASWNYNGNTAIARNGRSVRDNYKTSVSRYCDNLSNTVTRDSTYNVKIIPYDGTIM